MSQSRLRSTPYVLVIVAVVLAACSAYSRDPKPTGKYESASKPDPTRQEMAWSALSNRGFYSVSIRPAGTSIPIGKMHRWIINLRSPDGVPVYPARIHVGGGMEGHGHGLPTQPQVLRYGGEGDYLVEGVRFSMHGEWLLRFVIEASEGNDIVDFKILVDY